MGARRGRRSARAHRRRRLLRQEQRAGLSRHEPERPGADAGRRRLPAVGIQFDRALPRGQVWRRQAGACRSARTRAREQLDGLADLGRGTRDHAGVLGLDSNAGGKARCSRDRSRQGQVHGRDEDPGRAARQERVRGRRRAVDGRYPSRADGLSLPPPGAGTTGSRQSPSSSGPHSRSTCWRSNSCDANRHTHGLHPTAPRHAKVSERRRRGPRPRG